MNDNHVAVQVGWQRYTTVFATDAPHPVNKANHKYDVIASSCESGQESLLGQVQFQDGPIKEAGVNGVMNEDLLAMVIHRLQAFQESPYKCRENAIALTKLEEALLWLNKRTLDRERRGVEGTHTV